MPVLVGELSTLTTPLSAVRIWALVSGCLTFSLVASMDPPPPDEVPCHATFRAACMFVWCFFFALTFLILAVTFVQFHRLLPVSWKNLTVTVATLAALAALAATLAFPWLAAGEARAGKPRAVAAAVGAGLTFLAYAAEALLLRCQGGEQRGYMASAPGLLKVLQVFAGCSALLLLLAADHAAAGTGWRLWVLGTAYALCLLASLGAVLVVLGDCAGRCPLPFDRVLAGVSLLGVLLYMAATFICFAKVLELQGESAGAAQPGAVVVITETVVVCLTLLAYTVDLAFSVKLLCDRS